MASYSRYKRTEFIHKFRRTPPRRPKIRADPEIRQQNKARSYKDYVREYVNGDTQHNGENPSHNHWRCRRCEGYQQEAVKDRSHFRL